jgi:hypothetical protein
MINTGHFDTSRSASIRAKSLQVCQHTHFLICLGSSDTYTVASNFGNTNRTAMRSNDVVKVLHCARDGIGWGTIGDRGDLGCLSGGAGTDTINEGLECRGCGR